MPFPGNAHGKEGRPNVAGKFVLPGVTSPLELFQTSEENDIILLGVVGHSGPRPCRWVRRRVEAHPDVASCAVGPGLEQIVGAVESPEHDDEIVLAVESQRMTFSGSWTSGRRYIDPCVVS